MFRSCLANSFQEARQLINHGFVSVNGLIITAPNRKINKGDVIKIKTNSFNKDLFLRNVLSRSIPNYLELDLNNLTVILLWDVNFKNTYYPVKEKYVDISRYYK